MMVAWCLLPGLSLQESALTQGLSLAVGNLVLAVLQSCLRTLQVTWALCSPSADEEGGVRTSASWMAVEMKYVNLCCLQAVWSACPCPGTDSWDWLGTSFPFMVPQ
jgi:hypothetical protein